MASLKPSITITHGVKTGMYSKYYFNGALNESGEYDSEGDLDR